MLQATNVKYASRHKENKCFSIIKILKITGRCFFNCNFIWLHCLQRKFYSVNFRNWVKWRYQKNVSRSILVLNAHFSLVTFVIQERSVVLPNNAAKWFMSWLFSTKSPRSTFLIRLSRLFDDPFWLQPSDFEDQENNLAQQLLHFPFSDLEMKPCRPSFFGCLVVRVVS